MQDTLIKIFFRLQTQITLPLFNMIYIKLGAKERLYLLLHSTAIHKTLNTNNNIKMCLTHDYRISL